jgi:hypothetical protein
MYFLKTFPPPIIKVIVAFIYIAPELRVLFTPAEKIKNRVLFVWLNMLISCWGLSFNYILGRYFKLYYL